jgi:hypothetical protein
MHNFIKKKKVKNLNRNSLISFWNGKTITFRRI